MRRVPFTLMPLLASLALAQTPTPVPGSPSTAPIDTSTVERILRGEEAAEADQSFTYDAAGRRDPFRSLLGARLADDLGERPPGLRGMAIDEIKLEGIIKLPEGYVAMVQGTDNLSYLIRPGTVLYDGTVESIDRDRVVFRMQLADPRSLKPYREVVRTLE